MSNKSSGNTNEREGSIALWTLELLLEYANVPETFIPI